MLRNFLYRISFEQVSTNFGNCERNDCWRRSLMFSSYQCCCSPSCLITYCLLHFVVCAMTMLFRFVFNAVKRCVVRRPEIHFCQHIKLKWLNYIYPVFELHGSQSMPGPLTYFHYPIEPGVGPVRYMSTSGQGVDHFGTVQCTVPKWTCTEVGQNGSTTSVHVPKWTCTVNF